MFKFTLFIFTTALFSAGNFALTEKPEDYQGLWRESIPDVYVGFWMSSSEFKEGSILKMNCTLSFDRSVHEEHYYVHFLANGKSLGAYNIFTHGTDQSLSKFVANPENLEESKHQILELEGNISSRSQVETYSLLIKPNAPTEFSCKLSIPYEKHPLTFYSNHVELAEK